MQKPKQTEIATDDRSSHNIYLIEFTEVAQFSDACTHTLWTASKFIVAPL